MKLVNNLINSINMDTNDNSSYHHYSGICRNGKMIYTGCNHLRNSYNNECICWSTHAEMDVIHKVLKSYKLQSFKDTVNLNNHIIIVLRFGKDGSLKNSRPCNQCLETMVRYRIKKIMYSTDSGIVVSEKPENMERLHVSSGWNAFAIRNIT
jgi:cytidine deaminase